MYSKSCITSLPRSVLDTVSGTLDTEMKTIQVLLMGLTVHMGYETPRVQKSCFLNLKHPFRLVFHCPWSKCNLFGSSIGQEALVCVSQRWHKKNFHFHGGKRWSSAVGGVCVDVLPDLVLLSIESQRAYMASWKQASMLKPSPLL